MKIKRVNECFSVVLSKKKTVKTVFCLFLPSWDRRQETNQQLQFHVYLIFIVCVDKQTAVNRKLNVLSCFSPSELFFSSLWLFSSSLVWETEALQVLSPSSHSVCSLCSPVRRALKLLLLRLQRSPENLHSVIDPFVLHVGDIYAVWSQTEFSPAALMVDVSAALNPHSFWIISIAPWCLVAVSDISSAPSMLADESKYVKL